MSQPIKRRNPRFWCLTWNNYPDDYKEFIPALFKSRDDITYIIYCLEAASTTEKKHVHIGVRYTNQVSFATPHEDFKGCDHRVPLDFKPDDPTDRSGKYWIAYLKKLKTKLEGPFELGIYQQGYRTDIRAYQKSVDSGASNEELHEKHFGCHARFYKYVEQFQHYKRYKRHKHLRRQPKVYCIWGKPRSGKTTAMGKILDGKDWYRTTPRVNGNIWFAFYEGEKILWIDDIKPNGIDSTFFLSLADGYPVWLSVKHSDGIGIFDEIYFTSNWHPKSWFSDYQENLEAVLDRFDWIYEWPKDKDKLT